MNILITSAGRRVSLVRAFKKELKKVYPEAKCFAVDSNPKLSSACLVADSYFKVPKINDLTYFSTLEGICIEHNIGLVIPTIDTELMPMSKQKLNFLKKGIQFLVADEMFVLKCRNKRIIHDFFQAHQIEIAKEYAKDAYELPLFIKPIDGSRSVDTFIIQKEEDFTKYHFENEKLMFLEYLSNENYEEFTCDMYYDVTNTLRCVVPRKRMEIRDGEINKGVTCDNGIIPFLKERLATIEGAVGCLTAQFFMHKNSQRICGIEINPRFGGGFPLSYHAGANFPKWIIEEYGQKKKMNDKFDCWEEDLLMLRYDDEILVHGYKD